MKSKINYFSIAIILLSMLAIMIVKIQHVDDFVFSYTGERYFGGVRVVFNDAIIYSSVFALFGFSYFRKTPYILSVALRCMALFFLAIYIVDFYLITNFNTHLNVKDALKYSEYAPKYLRQIYGGGGLIFPLFPTAILGFVAFVLFRKLAVIQ